MKLTLSSSPHIKGRFKTSRIMLDVCLALLPALIAGVIIFGLRALLVVAVSAFSSVIFEWLWCKIRKTELTVFDGSAFVTGILLGLTLPVSVPLWQVLAGTGFAIIVIKSLFGGLGQNIFNPALAGRAFMLLIYPLGITKYPPIDAASSATPLHYMVIPSLPKESLLDMFLGRCAGSIGEISAIALLLGGAYLIIRRVISPRIPLVYIGTVFVLSLIFFKTDFPLLWASYNVLSGGLLLGAIFMATDYVTSPATPYGELIYGFGCGALTLLFRYFGLFPEGVTYAILLMNTLSFSIDKFSGFRRFGKAKRGKKR